MLKEDIMARPAERFVERLTKDEKATLMDIWKQGSTHRLRCRAHAILLSNDRWPVADIAKAFQVTIHTVYAWLDRWDDDQSLEDAPRCGAPPTLNDDEQRIVLEEVEKSPQNPSGVIEKVEERTGRQISRGILRRIIKNSGMIWKRLRGSLRDRRDPYAFEVAQSEIRELAEMAQERDFNLWFFDEAAFSLQPSLPYAWQKIAERIELPFRRGTSFSAIGFVDLDSNFFSYEVEGTVNSEVAIAVMDRFADQVQGFNVVVLDNAPVHRSNAFQDRIEAWAAKGLHLYFLPPYSPELNLIELVWKKIKHQWLPLKAYKSAQSLWDELGSVLAAIGKELKINFAPL
jgi:transposase